MTLQSLSPVLARYDPFGVDVPLNFDNTHPDTADWYACLRLTATGAELADCPFSAECGILPLVGCQCLGTHLHTPSAGIPLWSGAGVSSNTVTGNGFAPVEGGGGESGL